MNYETFLSAVAADEEKLANGIAPAGVDTCSDCGRPIVERQQPLGDGTIVCVGCYWGRMSAHLDTHPIRALRLSRVKGTSGIIEDVVSEIGASQPGVPVV